MSINLTRFYYDVDGDCRTGCFNGKVFEDIETIEADAHEKELQLKDIEYIRVDF